MKEELLKIINTDPNFRRICHVLNQSYADDIFQEVCLYLLETEDSKLPSTIGLNFWFYCVVRNMSSRTGAFGKIVLKQEKRLEEFYIIESNKENLIRKAEDFMLSLSEFENRIVLLYNELGDMKKVEKATGISYSALRKVKDKIKEKASQI